MPPAQGGDARAERRWNPRTGAARDSAAATADTAGAYVAHTADAYQHIEEAELNQVTGVRRPPRPTLPLPPRSTPPSPPPPPPLPAVSRANPMVGGPPSPTIRACDEPQEGKNYMLFWRETCAPRVAGGVAYCSTKGYCEASMLKCARRCCPPLATT